MLREIEFGVDIPLPDSRVRKSVKDTYGIKDFPIGDSRLYPFAEFDDKPVKKLSTTIMNIAKRHHRGITTKFVTRTVIEDGVAGLRVWQFK